MAEVFWLNPLPVDLQDDSAVPGQYTPQWVVDYDVRVGWGYIPTLCDYLSFGPI